MSRLSLTSRDHFKTAAGLYGCAAILGTAYAIAPGLEAAQLAVGYGTSALLAALATGYGRLRH